MCALCAIEIKAFCAGCYDTLHENELDVPDHIKHCTIRHILQHPPMLPAAPMNGGIPQTTSEGGLDALASRLPAQPSARYHTIACSATNRVTHKSIECTTQTSV